MPSPAPTVFVRLADRASEGRLLVAVIVYVVSVPASIVGWQSVLVSFPTRRSSDLFVSAAVRGLPVSVALEALAVLVTVAPAAGWDAAVPRSLNVMIWLGVCVPRLIELPLV